MADVDKAAEQAAWVVERRRAAELHAAAAQRQVEAEAAKAQALLDRFVADAVAAGIEPAPLRARGVRGSSRTFRTDRRGWYLRRDRSIAVDVDARYLVLVGPVSWWSVIAGTSVADAVPPLVVGRGGKDGDAIDLAELLTRRLAAGS